jgi:hypothetical protein
MQMFENLTAEAEKRFVGAITWSHEIGRHFFVRKRLKEIAFFPVSRNDTFPI